MKKTRILTVLLLLVPFALAFAGGQKANSTRTFGIVYPIIHPFFEGTTRGAQDTAGPLGIKLNVTGPERADASLQMEIIENMIAMKVDGIAIGSTDSVALTPLINKAMAAGIKVVCFDTDAPDSNRPGYIGTDNVNAGRHMGEILGRELKGQGGVLVSMGIPTSLNLIQRMEGVRAVLAEKFPGIKIIDEQTGQGDPNKTLANIEDMVNAHPDFNALIGIDAAGGPAAAIAWKSKGLKQTVVVFDDTDDIIQGVRDGYITSTIAQSQYVWGQQIVKELNDLCDGKTIPAFFDAGTREVNKTNIDELYPKK
jgi:ribose transport system substrate-binding protein